MVRSKTPILIISGPVGVGKTTIGHELSNSLSKGEIPHTFLDLDAVAQTYPRPSDDRFGSRLALTNLRDVWANCVLAGARNLVVARVVESADDVDGIRQVIPNSQSIVYQLEARDSILIDRIRRRELGSGFEHHRDRALELARTLRLDGPADFRVDTSDRGIQDMVEEIIRSVRWL